MCLAVVIYLIVIESDYISLGIFYGSVGIVLTVVFQCFFIQTIPSMICFFFSAEGDEFDGSLVAIISALHKIRFQVGTGTVTVAVTVDIRQTCINSSSSLDAAAAYLYRFFMGIE